MTAYRDWPVGRVKQALIAGGISRANKPDGIRNTPGIRSWEDLVRVVLAIPEPCGVRVAEPHTVCDADILFMQTLIFAGQHMENDKLMSDYHVPPVCPDKSFASIPALVGRTKPD